VTIDSASLVRPARLRPGARVATVSLSWGGPGAFPNRYRVGVQQFRSAFDVEVVAMPNALREPSWIVDHPAARAEDLHAAFADDSIDAIVSSIGGDDSIRILPHLDLDLIRSHPKVFMGFSDTTITHMACLRAGLVTFYGPTIMAGFAENGGPFDYMIEGVRQALFEPGDDLVWPENTEMWTVEHLDWNDPTNQDRIRERRRAHGWRWLGGVPAEGPLVAGCLEVFDWIRGTPWTPDLEGAVLAVETSEEQPSPEIVSRFLRSLAASDGSLHIAGLLFGRPGGSDLAPSAHAAYDAAIERVIRSELGLGDLPIVAGMDFGHTDPMWTLPEGMPVRVDPSERSVRLLRAGVTERTSIRPR
jgi:muramoyltetrapeptide carboxypeptidase LdcA involved in peptidoglycan recycling